MNFIKTVLFTNGNQNIENVCRNETTSQSYGEYYDDVSQDGEPIATAAGTEMENACSGSELTTDSESASGSTHLRGYETELNVYEDPPPTGTDARDDAATIRRQAIEMHEYREQLEDEREKRLNNASENSVLKSELAYMADALYEAQSYAAGLQSTVARVTGNLDVRTVELTTTLRQLRRESAAGAEKIARLEADKRELGDAADRLTAELETARSELARERALLRDRATDGERLVANNESLTRELDDVKERLERLSRDHLLTVQESAEHGAAAEDSRRTIDRLERELHRSSVKREETQRLVEKQQQDAADYVVDLVRKLERSKRENAALGARVEELSRCKITESVDVGSQTDHSPSAAAPSDFNGIIADSSGTTTAQVQDDGGGAVSETNCSSCSIGSADHDCISNYAKTEKIQELQRELDETKELYEIRERRYRETIEALENKASKYKTNGRNKANEYKLDVKMKDRQLVDISEEFKDIVRYKDDVIAFERNNYAEIRKQLDDLKMLLTLEKQNAFDGQIKCNDRIKALVEEIAAQNEKMVEMSNYIQGLEERRTKDGRPQKCAKPSRSVISYCGDVAAKPIVTKTKKNSPKTYSNVLAKIQEAIETQTAMQRKNVHKVRRNDGFNNISPRVEYTISQTFIIRHDPYANF